MAAPNGGSTASAGHSSAGTFSGSSGSAVGGSAGGSDSSGLSGSGGGSSADAGRGGDTTSSASGSAGMEVGGGSAGSAGTPGASTQPELVTSAANAYWTTTSPVTRLTSGTADLTVDENTKFQRWDGFGGCFNEMGWDALSVVSSEIPRAIKLLFDAKDGANFAYGRLPLGASDYSMSWYTLDDTAGDYTMDKFSIARDREKLIPFIKEALKIKPDLHLWASPWVVPSWMMDSSSNLKSDAQTLNAHALYMARFVEEYAKEGLKIEAIHPQNEPGYGRVHWTQALLIDFMKTYLGPTLAKRNLTTEVWCGTMSKDPDDTNIALATAKDDAAMKVVKGFGVQWNLQAAVATLAAKGPVMQTEHRCGNYNFESPYWDKSRYDSKKPQNDHLYGEESWQLIRDWIVSGVNSYSAWNMVLDTVGKSLDNWPQNALLVVDRSAKTLTATAAYYAFRHYSRYIAPGATRIAVNGSKDALAFKNPDGSIVTEIYNSSSAAKKTTLAVGGAFYQFDVPSHGWATLRVGP
ncbi:MAG TPA: glycoside hydrolase family 30 beta sandwich domain-containing protein [Polyangiaceae bacterium]|nr:glycoside hydrolase family 30 beta sandwich domain-containing protein [Polyangiaceae bacterium]